MTHPDWDAEAEAMDRACRHGGCEWEDTGPCLVCIAAVARRAYQEGLERAAGLAIAAARECRDWDTRAGDGVADVLETLAAAIRREIEGLVHTP